MKKKQKCDRKLLQNLEKLYTYKNEEFWNQLKQISGNASNKLPEYQSLPSLNDLDKHYKTLPQKSYSLTKQDFPEPLNTKPTDSLNQKIIIVKYLKTIKKLLVQTI